MSGHFKYKENIKRPELEELFSVQENQWERMETWISLDLGQGGVFMVFVGSEVF